MTTLLYIALNKITYYNELICSIKSIHKIEQDEDFKIVIYSDNIIYLKQYLSNENIIYEFVSEGDKVRYLGKNNYLYRIKLAILNEFSIKYNCDFIFVDSDTYFLEPIHKISNRLKKENCLLHAEEYSIGSYMNFELSEYFLKHNPIDIDNNEDIKKLIVWNSGIIGLTKSNFHILNDSIKSIDQLHTNLPNQRCLEQIILSFMIQKNKIKIESVENCVIHYWYIKEFNDYLMEYFKVSQIDYAYHRELDISYMNKLNKTNYQDLPTVMFEMVKKYRDIDYFNYHFQVFKKDSLVISLYNSVL